MGDDAQQCMRALSQLDATTSFVSGECTSASTGYQCKRDIDVQQWMVQEMIEVHKQTAEARGRGASGLPPASSAPKLDCQPNASAPLLRDEKSRKDWIDRELDICNQVPFTLTPESPGCFRWCLLPPKQAFHAALSSQCLERCLGSVKLSRSKSFPELKLYNQVHGGLDKM